jgi:hypothetical protein
MRTQTPAKATYHIVSLDLHTQTEFVTDKSQTKKMSQDSQRGLKYYRRKLVNFDVNKVEPIAAPCQSNPIFRGDSRKILVFSLSLYA